MRPVLTDTSRGSMPVVPVHLATVDRVAVELTGPLVIVLRELSHLAKQLGEGDIVGTAFVRVTIGRKEDAAKGVT